MSLPKEPKETQGHCLFSSVLCAARMKLKTAKDFREELRASEYRELMHHVNNELDYELAESHHAGIVKILHLYE